MNIENRSFVIDFSCCLPFGHNLQSMEIFGKKEIEAGRETKKIICRRLKNHMLSDNSYICLLPNLYDSLVISSESNFMKRTFLKIKYGFVTRVYGCIFFGRCAKLFIAKRAVNKILKKFTLTHTDHIVLPSADYYGTRAFLELLNKYSLGGTPSIHIRFIGVMEYTYHGSLRDLVKLINNYNGKVSISAEVKKYADFLNCIVHKTDVRVEPYPINPYSTSKDRLERTNDELIILLPGTNRVDKGYYDIYKIAKLCLYRKPNVKFIIQNMRSWDVYFRKEYCDKLKKLPNVKLVDAVLSRPEVEALYGQANAVLLPYNPKTYRLRGSAIHYEAILNRLPVIAKLGVGFEEEVRNYMSGWVYESIDDLIGVLNELSSNNEDDIKNMMEKASALYFNEINCNKIRNI